jgi:Na+-driven multidrug efflux pump
MIVFLWFSMVAFIILVGFVTLGVVFRHYWKESRKKSASAASSQE